MEKNLTIRNSTAELSMGAKRLFEQIIQRWQAERPAVERNTRFELATFGLGSRRSTN